MNTQEFAMSIVLAASVLLFLYFQFRNKAKEEEEDIDIYSVPYLCEQIRMIINEIVNMDLSVLHLNEKDLKNRKAIKRSLSDAARSCAQADIGAKMILCARIKSSLSKELGITEETIDETLPFNEHRKLTTTDMFEIIMYLQKRKGSRNMFGDICKEAGLDRLKKDDAEGFYYDISDEDMKEAYDKLAQPLSYDDKLNILTQRVYEETYGASVIDLLLMEDESIDSVSGGVSGITKDNFRFAEDDVFYGDMHKPKTHESVWIVYKGKPIHLKFLSFASKASLIRVCKNLAESRQSGYFTSSEGGLKTNLKNGSRATIFRPNNGSHWAFWVRKFGSAPSNILSDLITDKGYEYPVGIIKWCTKGCCNLFFSGDQNSGKTTAQRAAVREIDQRQQIRTIETDFEYYMNDAYAGKNIFGTKPTKKMSYSKLIELLKSSEAHTILFGETAAMEHAKHLIDLLLAGTKRILTTGHWPTTDEMIAYFVIALGALGSSEAEVMVARLLHLDVHFVKNDDHRYIDRITEVIPLDTDIKNTGGKAGIEGKLDNIVHYLEAMARKKTYYTQDIVVYENDEYKMVHELSPRLSRIILSNLSQDDQKAFLEFNQVKEREGREVCS